MTQPEQPANSGGILGCLKIGCGLALLFVLLFPVSCAFGPDWKLPILLWNLREDHQTGADGEDGPSECGYERYGYDPAVAKMTPFRQRLMKRFPPGSDQKHLVSSLQDMGFVFKAKWRAESMPCPEGIRTMYYEEDGIGPYFRELTAAVYWKPDRNGKIIWVKGATWRASVILW